MAPKYTKLGATAEPGSTADIKERVHVRSDATTHASDRQKIWGLIYKGIYAQQMAYASFYAMFAIYKILT